MYIHKGLFLTDNITIDSSFFHEHFLNSDKVLFYFLVKIFSSLENVSTRNLHLIENIECIWFEMHPMSLPLLVLVISHSIRRLTR